MTLKNGYILLLAALVFSCAGNTPEEEEEYFPIQTVKAAAKPMKNGFKPEDISLTTDMHVDSAFFIKWLENRKIAYSKRSAAGKLKLHDNWFFIDYHMIRPYTVFSILDDGHENLSSTLYHVIYDSQSKTIRSVNSLVSLETPDGYGNSDSLLWENDLLVKYSRKLDSVKVLETTVTRYEIKNGNFVVKKPANKD